MKTTIRFIHAADIHLDSPLRGLDAYEGMPADEVRRAPREAFRALVETAIQESVDFVVIAGDLTDGDWQDYQTGLFMAEQFARLGENNINVYLLRGNHDAAGEATKSLPWTTNVHEFRSHKAETFALPELKVSIHGRSFQKAETKENLAQTYPKPVEGHFNIAVLHTALEGYAEHASYAPCTLAELAASGHQYWALGHVHSFEVLSKSPWVVFPGNIQGRSIRETGAKGVVMVEHDFSTGATTLDRVILDTLRWMRVEADVSGHTDPDELMASILAQLRDQVATHTESMPLIVRIEIKGETELDGHLRNKASSLRPTLIAESFALKPRPVLEKVKVVTRRPIQVRPLVGDDALGELAQIFADAKTSPEFMAALKDGLLKDLGKVERVVYDELPDLDALRDGEVTQLLGTAAEMLMSRLTDATADA